MIIYNIYLLRVTNLTNWNTYPIIWALLFRVILVVVLFSGCEKKIIITKKWKNRVLNVSDFTSKLFFQQNIKRGEIRGKHAHGTIQAIRWLGIKAEGCNIGGTRFNYWKLLNFFSHPAQNTSRLLIFRTVTFDFNVNLFSTYNHSGAAYPNLKLFNSESCENIGRTTENNTHLCRRSKIINNLIIYTSDRDLHIVIFIVYLIKK